MLTDPCLLSGDIPLAEAESGVERNFRLLEANSVGFDCLWQTRADFSSQHAEFLPAKHRLDIHFLAHNNIHHPFPTPRELFCPQQLGSDHSALELCHRAVSLLRWIRALPLLYKGPSVRGISLNSTGFPSSVRTAIIYTPLFDYVSISQLYLQDLATHYNDAHYGY